MFTKGDTCHYLFLHRLKQGGVLQLSNVVKTEKATAGMAVAFFIINYLNIFDCRWNVRSYSSNE